MLTKKTNIMVQGPKPIIEEKIQLRDVHIADAYVIPLHSEFSGPYIIIEYIPLGARVLNLSTRRIETHAATQIVKIVKQLNISYYL